MNQNTSAEFLSPIEVSSITLIKRTREWECWSPLSKLRQRSKPEDRDRTCGRCTPVLLRKRSRANRTMASLRRLRVIGMKCTCVTDISAFARYCHVHIPLLSLRYTRSVHGTSHRAVFSAMSDCYLFALTMVSHANFTVSGRSEATMYEVSRRGLYRRRMAKPQDANGMGSSR